MSIPLARRIGFPTLIIAIGFASLAPTVAAQQKTKSSQVAANHMRWKNHDAVLANAIAWQEARDGQWVTVVLLTDKPIPKGAATPGKSASDLMEENKVQGIAFAVMSGGVPMDSPSFDIAYHDGAEIGRASANGAGGFEIELQSATQIKGHVFFNAFTMGSKDENAWSVSFDAPVLRGDAKRMAAAGEPLGAGGGQPGTDLLAMQKAKLAMDVATMTAYGTPEMAKELKDKQTLQMYKSMTSPQARVLGGLKTGDKARVYWIAVWPAGLDNRCVDSMILSGGKWRTTATACQAE
jgi:hypothetical protein